MVNNMRSDTNTISRRKLIQLCAVALVPIGFAYVLYFIVEGKQPWGSTSKGKLQNPIISADTLGLKNSQGDVLHFSGQEVWWLLVVSERECVDACENALHLVRGVHVLLNKDMPRVRRGLLSLVTVPSEERGATTVVEKKYPQLSRFTGALGALEAGVYIVDPLANIVLYYQYSEAGKPLLDDLKKLLKVSRIG
jgi:hypothetical protein